MSAILLFMTTTTIELFHGGPGTVTEIRPLGFEGIFASGERRAAESHGDHLTVIELDKSDVLTHYALNYEISDIELINSVLRSECATGADLERVWEIVIEDAGCECSDDDTELFSCVEFDDPAWEAQRIRGRVAAALGYRAVEMRDEHGTTYLIVRL